MPKRVVQVPVEDTLLEALDSVARKRGRSRAEIIREACQQYLTRVEQRQLEEVYVEGYRRIPEEPSVGPAQVALAEQVVSQESW